MPKIITVGDYQAILKSKDFKAYALKNPHKSTLTQVINFTGECHETLRKSGQKSR